MEHIDSSAMIRKTYIDFFKAKGHVFVRSSSLVPGGDETLLFTNAGMVQFKDIFLGIEQSPYPRVVNSQKCLRVAGKHNDLDDVGRDDTHHTFFEMLGNWSFGDYYKEEAIQWAWELLTEVWKLPKDKLYTTCFQDEKGEIPNDLDAVTFWRKQPGFLDDHALFFGRKDNFWEMADKGPCGPCSEIHFDRGIQFCNKQHQANHICQVNGDCTRFWELWNLVFIQYNRKNEATLEPLPATHVDTGMGFDRIVSILQGVPSNYETDLLSPLIKGTQALTKQTQQQVRENYIAYRVIADHVRAATFLIADGVVPGNVGRNYICRMIIRRAALFGKKLGLENPFLAQIASIVVRIYGEAYPELTRHQSTVFENITREEERFRRTIESGVANLENLLARLKESGETCVDGNTAFDLYATYGLPFEITRDLARDVGIQVDGDGFNSAMKNHRLSSGAGKAMGELGGDHAVYYQNILENLQESSKLSLTGVKYNPYDHTEISGNVLYITRDQKRITKARPGDRLELFLPETCFYISSGGQVSDIGRIVSSENSGWEVQVTEVSQPVAGLIVHHGLVLRGAPKTDDQVKAIVDTQRRLNIMRNHTATHLLHSELQALLGDHARQAGSFVAPDRLRFDFTHPESLTDNEIDTIEERVNQRILQIHPVRTQNMSLQSALEEGATALFGEKYNEEVRTIAIGEKPFFSYELCGGTHVENTGQIGMFLILSEGSVASGIRRIEAITGPAAYRHIHEQFVHLRSISRMLKATPDQIPERVESLVKEVDTLKSQFNEFRQRSIGEEFSKLLDAPDAIGDIVYLAREIQDADIDILRRLADRFRQRHPTKGIVVLGSVSQERPIIIAAITEDLIDFGYHAGELIQYLAKPLGGGGGGRSTLAQAGGKYPDKMGEALSLVPGWIHEKYALTH